MTTKKLFNVNLEIHTSPLFVAAAALILLGVKVREEDDLGKISRLMIEAGYLPWLRDASVDEGVAHLMESAKNAAQEAERDHGVEPDFEVAVRVFATDLLNYYGGIFGIMQGIATSNEKTNTTLLKSLSAIRNLDNLRDAIESNMPAAELERANKIRDALRAGEIDGAEALRQAGAPEQVVKAMEQLLNKLKGHKPEAEAEAEAQS